MKKIKEKIYESYFSSHYSSLDKKQNEVDYLKKSKHGQQFIEFLPSNCDIKIIDLGCGTGSLVSGLKNSGYKNVFGIDVSHENIEQGKLADLDIDYGEIIDFLDQAIHNNRNYDVIFLMDVLEHLDDNELYDVVDKVRKVLSSDGIFIIKTINAESLISGMGRYMDITHERSFTSHSMKELMSAFGYEELEILNSKINKPKNVREFIRSLVRKSWYYLIYRVIESRDYPECIDVDIVIRVKRGQK